MSDAVSSRRRLLGALVAGGAATLIDLVDLVDPGFVLARLAAQQPCDPDDDVGELLGMLPLGRAGWRTQPFGVKFGGAGLDARLVTDLSVLRPDRLITSNALAYIRTEAPAAVAAHRGPWTIRISGLAAADTGAGVSADARVAADAHAPADAGETTRPGATSKAPSPRDDAPVRVLSLDELTRAARPMGAHLFECSGNNNPANFGLMSVAEWDGVPLTEVLAPLLAPSSLSASSSPSSSSSSFSSSPPPPPPPPPLSPPSPARSASRTPSSSSPSSSARATGVLVSGVDHDGQRSAHSVGGASWILPLASLERLGAFLAVRMNGDPLPLDHGRPVRLVVPGWFGCAWIKWVNELRLVGPDESATSQMIEFAGRTHQTARHALARDYTPPEIQTAAMPVRVEKWRIAASRRQAAGRRAAPPSSRIEYRIVGIVWGGARPVDRLEIRLGTTDAWRPFTICPAPHSSGVWSLWAYRWRPVMTGLYDIALRVPDRAIPQRRLDLGHYVRQVNIDEV